MVAPFENVIAWQKSHQFVLAIYALKDRFPDFEKYGLWSQITRAAVSVPANIAEGLKKLSKADKLKFLNISQGSLDECRYYLLLIRDLKYISIDEYENLVKLQETTSYFLNSYLLGVVKDSGIKE